MGQSHSHARWRIPPSTFKHLRGTLYLWPDGILFLGENVRSKPHSHFTASLFWALHGSLRILAGPEQGWLTMRGALVAPNVRQQMDASLPKGGGLVDAPGRWLIGAKGEYALDGVLRCVGAERRWEEAPRNVCLGFHKHA